MLDSLSKERKPIKNDFKRVFVYKLKRNIHKLKELDLIEQLKHFNQSFSKMIRFIQTYIEKRLIKNDPKKWIKILNHRTILYYFIRQYKVKPYPKTLTYIRSKNQEDEHVTCWKNINPTMNIINFECKHDEFLNKNEVIELSNLIDTLIKQ